LQREKGPKQNPFLVSTTENHHQNLKGKKFI
jgi:hypothetical protein